MLRKLAVAVSVLLLSSGSIWAQSTSATITGRITDPSKASIVGAKVVATNVDTGVQQATATGPEGLYTIVSLQPGNYKLEVEKQGFKTVVKPDLVLHLQDVSTINFEMAIGALSESITVTGGAPMVNTTDAAVSTVVDQTYLRNMPLNGRSFQDLILLTPGIVMQGPQNSVNSVLGATGEFSVNGQRGESNYYSVDGVSANVGATPGFGMATGAGPSGSVAVSTALGTTQALVSVDALQEFRVQSSTYSAEYGRNPGGQFVFETKSGTNQWHGTAYDYLRNGFFDAQDWFNDYFGTKEPPLRQNDFGGTLGGPIEIPGLYHGKNKTFFFISYEGLRLTQSQAATVNYVPDATLRSSSPVALQAALNAFPLQSANGIDDTTNGIAQYIGSWSNPASLDAVSVRFDHVVNDSAKLFFRFSDTPSSSTIRGAGGLAPSSTQTAAYTSRSYTGGFISALASNLSNDIRLNYSTNEGTARTDIDAFGGSTPVNLAQLSGLNAGSTAELALVYGGYALVLPQQQQSGGQRQWNLVDTASLSWGRHQVRLGVDYRRLAPFDVPFNPVALYLYLAEAAVNANSAIIEARTDVPGYPLYQNFSAFAQDEWKVSQRLSVSLGLRWEVNPAPGVTKGLQAYTVQGSGPNTWTLAPQGTPLWQTTWFNFAPRLGAAYVLRNTPGWEMVVRGGGGVFFDTGQQLGSLGFDAGPGFGALAIQVGSFPQSVVPPPVVNPPAAQFGYAYGFAPHLQLPYTLQWNASVEQALGKSQALTASYVGSHAARLLQENQFFPSSNPNASSVLFVENGLTSDYDSLQIQFRRRLSHGLTALGSYTWSHCIDYGSQNYLVGFQRGNCDFDVRHTFSGALSYDVPGAFHNPIAHAFLHHWGIDSRISARSGFPVTLLGSNIDYIDPLTGQLAFAGLDLVPNQPVYLYGSNCTTVLQGLGDLAPGQVCPGGRAINPQAFANPTAGNGNAPRNFVRGFGAWQTDLSVRREFPIHERLRLQFRAEAFNIFNHPNFGTVNPNFGQLTFGQATATLANSLGVLSPLYQMGGPRSMQFALKIIF